MTPCHSSQDIPTRAKSAIDFATPRSPTSVAAVPRDANPLCVPVCCDNFV
jgi:hypothetical protein